MTILSTRNVGVMRGQATLLADVSVDFGASEAVAVIGPNGSGKSTLLKVLAGIEAPSSGEIRLNGRAPATLSSAARAKLVGYLPQQFQPHWDLSVSELVRLGAERMGPAAESDIERAIAEFELTPFRRRKWSTLSGGERARTLLATVLSIDPQLLLADEPAASLDIRHRIEVSRALARRGKVKLSIVVMHDLELAFQLFDRIVLMNEGRIVADGPASEVVHDEKLDEVFGVRFARVEQDGGVHLQVASTKQVAGSAT
jgi:iron complex transport system ATP-binding protein